MKKQLVMIGILAVLVSFVLSGCTNNSLESEINKFVGTWKLDGIDIVTITFYLNGTCLYVVSGTEMDITEKGTWEINNGKFTNTLYQHTRTFTYSFSDKDKTLTLTGIDGGEITVFKKQ